MKWAGVGRTAFCIGFCCTVVMTRGAASSWPTEVSGTDWHQVFAQGYPADVFKSGKHINTWQITLCSLSFVLLLLLARHSCSLRRLTDINSTAEAASGVSHLKIRDTQGSRAISLGDTMINTVSAALARAARVRVCDLPAVGPVVNVAGGVGALTGPAF